LDSAIMLDDVFWGWSPHSMERRNETTLSSVRDRSKGARGDA
jgi:hypothetical protein